MPRERTHLIYNKEPEGTAKFYYSPRKPSNEEEGQKETPKIMPNVRSFRGFFNTMLEDIKRRTKERNREITVPEYITCIEINFYKWFNSADFEVRYRNDFGLTPIKYYDSNKRVLFAVADNDKFQNFLTEIQKFIHCEDHRRPDYNRNIKYIISFKLHTTKDILSEFDRDNGTVYLAIIDNLELDQRTENIVNSLKGYLRSKNIEFNFNDESYEFEIIEITNAFLKEIAQNFDIVHSVNSRRYSITRPSRFGTNIREYPFSIELPSYDIPIIGVIDTGVSVQSPLARVMLNSDNSFGLQGMDPRIDEAFNGDGHGTGVAGFIALGNQLSGNINAQLTADARILSIKILSEASGNVKNSDVINLITKANNELGIKIFTLTLCYSSPLKKGQPHSDYAYLLDKLAYDKDILVFICTANYTPSNLQDSLTEYPAHFLKDETNLCTPSESMNNFTVGAIGDNFEPEIPIRPEKYPLSSNMHPTTYTRKYNLDYENITLKNAKIIKPDVVYSGGNYTCINHRTLGLILDSSDDSAMNYLSANPTEPILRGIGTSYSTPLVANIAAKISSRFPKLKPQTLKALIINSAEEIIYDDKFDRLRTHHKRFISGHGKPNIERCIASNDNEVTIIIEDKIEDGIVKTMPIKIPGYLNNLPKNEGLLKIEATLCYKFLPVKNNQLAYCPVNIAFGILRNVPIEDNIDVTDSRGRTRKKRNGISGGSKEKIAISNQISWSQDGFWKNKLLSNAQKISFYVKRDEIIRENNTFNISVHCHLHKILPKYIKENLPKEYEYSLVIRLKENQKDEDLTGKLYSEILQINDLILMQDARLDSDADIELTN